MILTFAAMGALAALYPLVYLLDVALDAAFRVWRNVAYRDVGEQMRDAGL